MFLYIIYISYKKIYIHIYCAFIISRFIFFLKFSMIFSCHFTNTFPKKRVQWLWKSAFMPKNWMWKYSSSPSNKIFLFFFVNVIRMYVTSFGRNPHAGSAVLIIMDRSYYGTYIAGETGFIPHRDELSIYYSPWSFLGINNRGLLRTSNPVVTLWINLRRLNRRIGVKC